MVQLNLNFTRHTCDHYMSWQILENACDTASKCMTDRWRKNAHEVHGCTHSMLVCCHEHHGLHEQHTLFCTNWLYRKLKVPFIGLKVLLTVLTLTNKYIMSYGNTHYTTTYTLTLWFTLKNLESKFLLSSISNAVNQCKGNTHHVAFVNACFCYNISTYVDFYKVWNF